MNTELILSVVLGIGLAAACGFRVFLPLFLVSLLSHFGFGDVPISGNFNWIATFPALITFGIATIVEIFAYFIPFIDNLLDTVAIPLAAIAGTLVMLSTMMELEPFAKWSIAIIAGGGLAGTIKGFGATTRVISSATTAGIGNPVISTAETGASALMTLVAWFIPILALFVLAVLFYILIRFLKSKRKKPAQKSGF